MKRIVVGVTGASGMLYAKRLIEILSRINDITVHVIISENAKTVSKLENVDLLGYDVCYENNDNLSASLASGSVMFDAMIVIPCSMKTMATISNGFSSTLISRIADVALKERRKLIIVPRESPYSRIHLTNMLTLNDAGALILPASPPMYNNPKTVLDLVDMIVARILDHCDIKYDNLGIGYMWKS